MSEDKLILAVPSKGRLMENTQEAFAKAGLNIYKTGHERGYMGAIEGVDHIEVAFLSASEIAYKLRAGQIHMGVTGEDLLREAIFDLEKTIDFVAPLGFGHADVVVAVPECWIDVSEMADLEDVAVSFQRIHGRRLRVATKYMNLTRGYFAKKGVAGYRIVESLGATEGTPSAGTAELIVDITSTGSTLQANHLKILDDGCMLKSEANLVLSHKANWEARAVEMRTLISDKFNAYKSQ